jgi:uncharacterized protein
VAVVDTTVDFALRASSYTVYVDLPDDAEHVLLVHGYSGAYDLVSRGVARWLRSIDRKPPKPLYGDWAEVRDDLDVVTAPSDATIELLERRGYVTQLSRDDERARFDGAVGVMHRASHARMPSYIIMPTYDCNLRCAYCFQDHMRKDPAYGHLLRAMTPKQVDRMVAAMPQIEARHGIEPGSGKRRGVTFFGGEPLLARNYRLVAYIMDAIRAIGPVTFSAVSNATEFGACADLLGPDGIATIQVTIDGPAELHDKRRVYADGSGSFAQLCANIDLAIARGVHVDARMNIDRTNIGSLPAVADVFAERGWAQTGKFSAYVAPVRAANDNVDRRTTYNSAELRDALVALHETHPQTRAIGTSDDTLRSSIEAVFRGGRDAMTLLKASYCGAHKGMYVFDALGDIYACWEKTGDKNIRVGWIDETGKPEFVADRLQSWRSRTINSNQTCAQCRYSTYCGGGCAVLAEGIHDTIFGNYCDAFGKRFRIAAAEAYARFRSGAPLPNQAAHEMRAL